MPRIARVTVPDIPYHITQRGNSRRALFFTDTDRRTYIRSLGRFSHEYRVQVLAYCLMSNHVHLIAVPERADSLARALGCTHADFARYRNAIDGGCGHVWQARYFSCPLDEAHLWGAIAYVERNPVHAGMVASAEEYRWSSARAHLGCKDETGFVDLTGWLTRYDPSRWREVLHDGVGEAGFRDRLREASRQGRALGSGSFVEQLELRTGRRLRPKPAGRPKKDDSAAAQMSLEIGV